MNQRILCNSVGQFALQRILNKSELLVITPTPVNVTLGFIRPKSSASLTRNHYEVLGLSESCSQDEIKEAFLSKCKQCHPDKNDQNPENHILIVAVNEAYATLSKQQSRKIYDYYLLEERNRYVTSLETNVPRGRVTFYDDSLWEHRNRDEDKYHQNKAYYGIKGMKKLPNHYIAGGVILFMFLGAVFHFIIASVSTTRVRNQLEKRDLIASQNYLTARETAKSNGNVKQLHLLVEALKK